MTPSTASRSRQRGGFTLIELLVVMAIIATLAGLGIVGIPRIMRQGQVTACKDHLSGIFKQMMVYSDRYKGFPTQSGREFVFAIWQSRLLDHNRKDSEILFCPSLRASAPESLEDMTADDIDYTGPDLSNYGKRLQIADRNANDKIIVCDRVVPVVEEKDKDRLPHAAEGICYLTLGGASEFMDVATFGGDYIIIGPESPRTEFQWMVPDEQ